MVLNENGGLLIRKRKQSQWVLLLVMLWPFIVNFLSNLPSPLDYIRYLCDGIILCWCLGDFIGIIQKSAKLRRDRMVFVLWVCAFLVYTFVVYICNYQSAAYYLWGIRMNFRGYIVFLRILHQINEDDAEEWLWLLDFLFWINAGLAFFQFFIGGVRQDYLGGVFGTEARTNGHMLIFLSIVVVKSQFELFEHKEKLWICLTKCTISLLIAAMAELKFYILLFVFQMVLVAVLTRFSWKKVVVMSLCASVVSLAMSLLAQWFSSSGKFDIAVVIEKAFQENYASANDVNRFSAISTLSHKILQDPVDRIFGLGLGNCDKAGFAFLRTPFYEKYSALHYSFFAAPMVFLETGYLGLVFYAGFFVVCFIKSVKNRRNRKEHNLYDGMGIVFSITAIFLMFYNASLRYEAGWLVFITLALPFVSSKEDLVKG